MKQGLKQAVVFDKINTPAYAVKPILPFLDKNLIVWECTGKDSEITKVLRDYGMTVIETSLPEMDFLSDDAEFHFDIVITNPPYSEKTAFLRRCYEYNKPFMLLLPITALEGIERGSLFNDYGIQVLVLDKRIDFTGKKSCWFNTSWFCNDILPKDLMFSQLGDR